MSFTRLEFEKKWTDTPWTGEDAPFPTYQDSEALIRADLQYHPDAILAFLNGFLDALEDPGAAAAIGADFNGTTGKLTDVLAAQLALIQANASSIETLSSGGVPELLKGTRVPFSAGDWTEEEGVCTLSIPADTHKRAGECFTFTVWQDTDSGPDSGTWAAGTTAVLFGPQAVTLKSDLPYDGAVTFFGL